MQHSSLRQKIRQLFLVGFAGDSLSSTHPIIADIREEKLRRCHPLRPLSRRKKRIHNIINPKQLQRLTTDLQDLAGGHLLIAVDQEGGKVNRFRQEKGFPITLSAAELGSMADIQTTVASARQTSRMLRAAGVNLNLSPVVDLNVNKDNPIIGCFGRRFRQQPDGCCPHAAAWINEHRALGIQCCLKHFPGHGSSP